MPIGLKIGYASSNKNDKPENMGLVHLQCDAHDKFYHLNYWLEI
jgi:hypothetical protein